MGRTVRGSGDRLPRSVADLVEEWGLAPEGAAWPATTSVVVPVRAPTGDAAVLKVGVAPPASTHEHVALQHWHGRGAVRLLRADPGRGALLLERLERVDLTDAWAVEACEVVAGLYAALHVPPLPQLRTQASYVERWAEALRRDLATVPVPRRLVEQALHLAGDLCAEPATAVVHGDLHYANVLRGRRDDEDAWLAIDPKPTNGDPHSELEPMLRNRFENHTAPGAGSVRDGIRRRFHTLVDVAGLDEDRARDWVVVRSVLNAHWAHRDAVHAGRSLTADERNQVTSCIAVAKAVQD